MSVMNYALCHLAYMALQKNELNRKRRRFYGLLNPRYEYKDRPNHKSFSKTFCKESYQKARKEMKAMTATIRELREACGARFNWDANWRVKGMWVGKAHYSLAEMQQMADVYVAESKLFG